MFRTYIGSKSGVYGLEDDNLAFLGLEGKYAWVRHSGTAEWQWRSVLNQPRADSIKVKSVSII